MSCPGSIPLRCADRLSKLTNKRPVSSEFSFFWCSWKRNYIPDIGHSGNKHDHSFKTKTESCMRYGTKFSCLQVPPQFFFRDIKFFNFLLQHIISFLSL